MADDCHSCEYELEEYTHTCGKEPKGTEINGHLFYDTCQCKFCVRCKKPACSTEKQCDGKRS